MPKLIASPLSEYPNPTFANDLLGRQGFGERLLGLVKSASAGAVLALDAPWGEGKTTFVRMWKNLLEEKGYSAVYLDAFEQDHQEDPFLPLVASILDAASAKVEDQATLASKIDSLRKKAGQVGVRFSGWLTRLAVRSATLGIIRDTDLEALDDIRTELAGDVSKAVEVAIESRLSTFKAEKNALQEFRLELEALAKAISSSSGGPLVVIVDELDRCRPSFALNLIERIKHVLDVPGVMFLFVLNRPQLEESVRSVYGPGIDAPGYVAKFVHVWCSLPKRGRRGHDTDSRKRCLSFRASSNSPYEKWSVYLRTSQSFTLPLGRVNSECLASLWRSPSFGCDTPRSTGSCGTGASPLASSTRPFRSYKRRVMTTRQSTQGKSSCIVL
jgi:hypothetical protein